MDWCKIGERMVMWNIFYRKMGGGESLDYHCLLVWQWHFDFFCSWQAVQLLICDILLSIRTTLWQKQANSSQAVGEAYQASSLELKGFQQDLSSLRKLGQTFKPAHRKVSKQNMFRASTLITNWGKRSIILPVTFLSIIAIPCYQLICAIFCVIIVVRVHSWIMERWPGPIPVLYLGANVTK